nr:tetratricopeptide repeat-containing glycosyltransferase family protein [uncultured Rhodopila sp.]
MDLANQVETIKRLFETRQFPLANELLTDVITEQRHNYTFHFTQGVCLYEMGRFDEAAEAHQRALTLNFSHAKGWLKLGACHLVRQRWPEALACYERGVNLDPNDAELLIGFGTMVTILGDDAGAEKQYRKALKLNPKAWEAEVALGFVLLRSGKWTEGWARFEKRWRLPQFAALGPATRMWTGAPRQLAGKRVVVICEQGFGDTFQFARYLPLLVRAVGSENVTLMCPPALERILGTLVAPGVHIQVQNRDPMPEHDILTALMSLPHIFETTLRNVPPPARYGITARPTGARIGVCWHGGARVEEPLANADDQRRSVPLEVFQPIIDAAGGQAISLQQEDLLAWGCKDWVDTAEIIAGLDLVITVDTAIAHLAASLGIETWILCRAGGCWRWLSTGDTTVWYPSVRLFRQTVLSDWAPCVERVAAELRERLA